MTQSDRMAATIFRQQLRDEMTKGRKDFGTELVDSVLDVATSEYFTKNLREGIAFEHDMWQNRGAPIE